MKKLFYAMLLGILGIGWASAQSSVTVYDFKAEKGSYTALGDDATELTKSVIGKDLSTYIFNTTDSIRLVKNDTAVDGIPFGFDFEYDGKIYDKFVIAGIGYIYLGLKTDSKVNVNVPGVQLYQLWQNVKPTIGLSSNASSRTSKSPIKYQIDETDPDAAVVTVEFSDVVMGTSDPFDYQIRLYEADNRIEFSFGGLQLGASWFDGLAVGLCAESGAHYRVRETNDWLNTTYSNSGSGWGNNNTVFEEGLLYTFSVPAVCEKPTVTVSNLNLKVGENIDLTAEVTAGVADAYLIVASKTEITGSPVDGEIYQIDDELLGGTVLAMGDLSETQTEITATHSDPDPNTEMHYAVYLYNYKCSGEARYGDRVTESALTNTASPAALKITAVSDTEIRLTAEANESDEDILVAVTEVLKTDEYGNRNQMVGDFGVPVGDVKVGDSLKTTTGSYGGTIIYMGPAGDIVFNESLKDNTIYHFAAFSKQESTGRYSPVFVQADTITPAKLPFFEDFLSMPTNKKPYGWNGTTEYAGGAPGGFYVQPTDNEGFGSVQVSVQNPGDYQLVLPAMAIPDAGVRLELNYRMRVARTGFPPNYSCKPADWEDTDSISFEASTDGGMAWSTAYVITKATADTFATGEMADYIKRDISIEGVSGNSVLLRMRYSKKEYGDRLQLFVRSIAMTAIEAPCSGVSALTVSDTTDASAKLAWEGEATDYQVAWRKKDATAENTAYVTGAKTYTLNGLDAETAYEARVRNICGESDTSAWCEWVGFTTKAAAVAVCPVPTDLEATSITFTTARLTWACDAEDAEFVVRYKATSDAVWDTTGNLTVMEYSLTDLKPNTAYTWTVRTACTEDNYSDWAEEDSFTTEGVGNEDLATAGLRVSAAKGQIHVINPSAIQIDRIRIIGTEGTLYKTYTVRSNDNVLLTTDLSMKVVVVVVESNGKTFRFKVLLHK